MSNKYDGLYLLEVAQSFNNFYFEGKKKTNYKPLTCQGYQIGLVSLKAGSLATSQIYNPPTNLLTEELFTRLMFSF